MHLIQDFIDLVREAYPVIDARSPKEFQQGHIPGAVNLPLLNDEERKTVGITYKEKGSEAAVAKGFELTGSRFAVMIEEAKSIAPGKTILIYCWRGGMRSGVLSWILSLAGFKTIVLRGGYKSFRKWTADQLNLKKNLLVLSGYTGSGKTALLMALSASGEKIIDLEQLANHKGSAFGSLGQEPQPSTEHFENQLAMQWSTMRDCDIVWIENESRLIGKNLLPDAVFMNMIGSPMIEIILDRDLRVKRILEEYGKFPVEVLKEKTNKIAKRLGGLRLKQAIEMLEKNDLEAWVGIMLEYYDNTYEHHRNQHALTQPSNVYLENDDMQIQANKLIALKKKYGQPSTGIYF